jgi:hypothetical protein
MTAVIAGGLILAGWPLLSAIALAADVAKQAKAEKPADCRLILEGRHIEKLVLSDKHGKVINLVHPGARVLLPAGDYQIEEIEVQGGYWIKWSIGPRSVQPPSPWPPQSDRLLTLSPDQPCRPNIGMPLKPEITAQRVGRLLKVSYKPWLRDGDQRGYLTLERTPPPPRLAVYRGDREITAMGTGSLEYG